MYKNNSNTSEKNKTNSKYGWIVITVSFLILLCLGVAYSWGIFVIPIKEETGWSRASISLASSILLLIFSFFMPVGGFLEQKIGPRKTVLSGGILISMGWILGHFTNSLSWLYLTYGLMAGIGTGFGYLPSISTSIRWFQNKKGLAVGIVVSGFGLGSAFLAPLGVKLIEAFGWRKTMLVYGISFGLIINTLALFLKNPFFQAQERKITNFTEDSKKDLMPLQLIREKSFKIIFITYFFAMLAGMTVVGHIASFLQDIGFNKIQSSVSLVIFAIFNSIGRILIGYISDRIEPKTILIYLFIFLGLSIISLNLFNFLQLFYIATAIIGICFGGFLSVYPVITSNYFGMKHFGTNYGLVFMGYGMGCFAGPLMGGLFHDKTGSYVMAFYTSGLIALIAGLISLNLKK